MLKNIIYKELLDNLLNLRFTVGLVLCLVLTVSSVAVLSHDYSREL